MELFDWDLWLSVIHFLKLSTFDSVIFSSNDKHFISSVSFNFHPFPHPSFFPSSQLGATLSSPPVSEFSRRDHRGIRNDVWLQSWRRAPVDGEFVLCFEPQWSHQKWKCTAKIFILSSNLCLFLRSSPWTSEKFCKCNKTISISLQYQLTCFIVFS